MMNFQQACAYVRATGGSAYCYTPWMHDGEWIGVQHCTLYEPDDASDVVSLGMRLRRVARGVRDSEVIEVASLDAWDGLPPHALEAQYGVDPRGYRYAASDTDAAEISDPLQFPGNRVTADAGTASRGPGR